MATRGKPFGRRRKQARESLARLPGDPTPKQIAALCLEIQAGWSHWEFEKRHRGMTAASGYEGAAIHEPWEFPLVHFADLRIER